MSAEEHASLEDERDFLLRSLDDLDAELLAGNIDPDTYRVLHDDYTARASAVIQSIADGVKRGSPDRPRVPPALRAITIGGIVVFALLAAILLAHTAGQRRPGQQITGDAQSGGSTTTTPEQGITAAKQVATAEPKSYDARIRYARALFAAQLYPAALPEYLKAAKLDKTQAEPIAYTGWLTGLFALTEKKPATKQALFDAASTSLDRAISVDPTYPDSYVLKGLLLSQIEKKPCLGAGVFQQFLATAADDNPMRPMALSALAQAVKAGNCPEPKTTPTTPTTKP